MPNPNNPMTTVRVPQGSDVQVSGDGPIRVLVVHNTDNGDVGYRNLPEGSRVGDVLPNCVNRVLVNGKDAQADQPLKNGDKVSEVPPNIEGA
jgi:hypothetical protein